MGRETFGLTEHSVLKYGSGAIAYKERFFEFEISASFFCSILCYAAIEAVKDYADKDIFTEQSVKIIDNRHNPDLLLPPFSDSQL